MNDQQHQHEGNSVESTARLEAFSDCIYGIAATLLVLDLRVPVLTSFETADFRRSLLTLLPAFLGFFFSFFTIAVFWVNHHHFFHAVTKVNGKVLWYNNFHLFWIATIPFTTALIGRYHTQAIPVVVYALSMLLAAISLMATIHYVFFRSNLLETGYPEKQKQSEFRRGFLGIYLYLLAIVCAPLNVNIALIIFAITPLIYVVPRVLSGEK